MVENIDTVALLNKVDIVSVIGRRVPLKKSGAEYEACCPFHTESTPSFKVSPSKQFYNCFGCGAHGDAIKFVQEYQGLSFVDACKALGDGEVVDVSAPVRREIVRDKRESPWTPILPAPSDAPEPPKAHVVRGQPERVWCYPNQAGAALGYVYRFKTSTGGKETLPLVWCRHAQTGEQKWHWMAFPEPRPLYGLDRLAAKPDATVLLVEGEKCADAGHAELPDLAVVSWPGGGKAVKKVDWTALAGRKVILWADADAKRVPLTKAEKDALPTPEAVIEAQANKPLLPEDGQPGVKTMAMAAELLHVQGCKLWSVKIPAPGEKADGWDIADAIEEGLAGEALAAFIRGNISLLAVAEVGGESLQPNSDGGISPPVPAGAGGGADDNGPSWRTLLMRKDDRLIDCRENVYLMLKHHPAWAGVLWADEFARKIVKRKPAPWDNRHGFVSGEQWGEDDDLRLGLWFAQRERLLVRSPDVLAASVGWAARESRCHPVREYLDSLSWDGRERTSDWLTDYWTCHGLQPRWLTVSSRSSSRSPSSRP